MGKGKDFEDGKVILLGDHWELKRSRVEWIDNYNNLEQHEDFIRHH